MIPNIQIKGLNIEHVNTYKYLGVYIDVNLDWDYHVNHMANNISQRLGVLKRVTRHLTGETSKMLYNSLALIPLFDYCDINIVNSNSVHLKRLHKLQNRGARIILNLGHRSHLVDMLRDLMWLDVKQFSDCR